MPSELVFPHLTDTGPTPNHHDVEAKYEEVFAARVADGVVRPFVVPYFFYGLALLFIYLCIPHTKSPALYAARWPVAIAVISFQLKVLLETSSGNVGVAALAGGGSGMIVMLALTWLIWCKPQFNAKRVQKRKKQKVTKKAGSETDKSVLDGSCSTLDGHKLQQDEDHILTITDVHENIVLVEQERSFKQRRVGNRELNTPGVSGRHVLFAEATDNPNKLKLSSEEDEFEYYWETYPDNLLDRIPWLIDLLSNPRGAGWNWAIPTLPDLPDHIKKQLGEPIEKNPAKRTSNRIFPSSRALVEYRLPQLLICWLLYDAIKTLQMKDPYFIFGPSTYELPPHLKKLSLFGLFAYRYFLCCTFGFAVPLQFAFVLQDLGMSLAGPRILGVMGEPWRLPTTWGTAMSVFNSGLGGFWANLWHQRLRIFFSTPVDYLIEHGYLTEGSIAAKRVGLFLAFAISGFVHSCISIAQFQHTNPWRMFIFFLLHALGIVLQTSFCAFFRPQMNKFPKGVRQIGNFIFTFTWCTVTGPLFADDVARGGSWLNEAVPISLFRGLGLGVKGDGWWCWGGYIKSSWYSGKHWWESGFVL